MAGILWKMPLCTVIFPNNHRIGNNIASAIKVKYAMASRTEECSSGCFWMAMTGTNKDSALNTNRDGYSSVNFNGHSFKPKRSLGTALSAVPNERLGLKLCPLKLTEEYSSRSKCARYPKLDAMAIAF